MRRFDSDPRLHLKRLRKAEFFRYVEVSDGELSVKESVSSVELHFLKQPIRRRLLLANEVNGIGGKVSLMNNMKPYRLFKKGIYGIFYIEEKSTGRQTSLKTKEANHASKLFEAKCASTRDAVLNREIGLAYLRSSDPKLKDRKWTEVMEGFLCEKTGATLRRAKIGQRQSFLPTADN